MPSYPSSFFAQPFASEGDRTVITAAAPAKGRASLKEGFPPATSLPVAQGGIAPSRLDFNGILYMLSAMACWQQSGGQWQYSGSLAYTPPAVVFYAGKYWQCLKESTPDAPKTPGTDGRYWKDLSDFLGTLKSLSLTGDAEGSGTLGPSGSMELSVTVKNAAQAAKLKEPMTLTFAGQTNGSVTFDGSGDASVSLSISGFLPTSGGEITGPITWGGTPLIRSVNGTAADETGNVVLSALGKAVTLTGKDSITVPAGGRWAVVYFNWGTDWGMPYCVTVAGGTVLKGGYNRICALCIKISE